MFIDIGKFIVNVKEENNVAVVRKIINTDRILSLHQYKIPPVKSRGKTRRRAKTAYYIIMHGSRVEHQLNKAGFETLSKILIPEE